MATKAAPILDFFKSMAKFLTEPISLSGSSMNGDLYILKGGPREPQLDQTPPPPAQTPKALSEAEALAAFDVLANKAEYKFAYIYDLCYARAQLMGEDLRRMGIEPGRAWAFEDEHGNLLQPQFLSADQTTWWWHVAVTVPVQQMDGTVQTMVIDPGLFDGPITLAQWGNIMGAQASQIHTVGFEEKPPKSKSHYMFVDTLRALVTNHSDPLEVSLAAKSALDECSDKYAQKMRELHPSEMRQRLAAVDVENRGKDVLLKAQGPNWYSRARLPASQWQELSQPKPTAPPRLATTMQESLYL